MEVPLVVRRGNCPYASDMPSESQLARKVEAFAVVRIDDYEGVSLQQRITIKEILPTIEEAVAEVARLNALPSRGNPEYFVAGSKWLPDGRGARADY